mgnify:FL=1
MNDIVILSPDELFGRMLADECTFCGFPACVFPVADEHVSAARAVLIDLDRIRPVPSPAAQTIGFSADPDALPEEVKSGCCLIFHRPFPVKRLREELYRLFPESRVSLPEGNVISHRIAHPALTLDPLHMRAVMGEYSVSLSYREFALLGRLLAANGEVVPKGELDALLGSHESNMTETYICRLRRKTEKVLGMRLIESVRGVGYRYRAK